VLYIDDAFSSHPKILKAGAVIGRNGEALALAMYVHGLTYARKHHTDGFIPDEFIRSCVAFVSPVEIARVLTDRRVRLWERRAGGYLIHDYHDWNRKASEIKEQREKWRTKKAAQRRGNNGQMSRGVSPGDTIHVSQMSHRDSRACVAARTRSHDPRTTGHPCTSTQKPRSTGTGFCTFRVLNARFARESVENKKTKTPTHKTIVAMLHAELAADPSSIANAIEGVKVRCARQGFTYPAGDRLDAAIHAITRKASA
jgi:hypothetical protein